MFRSQNGNYSTKTGGNYSGWRESVITGSSPDFFFRESNENFQQYPSATYDRLDINTDTFGNLLWKNSGQILYFDYTWNGDDMQSYSNGTYSSLSGGSPYSSTNPALVGNAWAGAASITDFQYTWNGDDFQGYSGLSGTTVNSLTGGTPYTAPYAGGLGNAWGGNADINLINS
jgi:hypothetical protein